VREIGIRMALGYATPSQILCTLRAFQALTQSARSISVNSRNVRRIQNRWDTWDELFSTVRVLHYEECYELRRFGTNTVELPL